MSSHRVHVKFLFIYVYGNFSLDRSSKGQTSQTRIEKIPIFEKNRDILIQEFRLIDAVYQNEK